MNKQQSASVPVRQTRSTTRRRHCQAQRLLGYAPTHRLAEGIAEAMPWYVGQGK